MQFLVPSHNSSLMVTTTGGRRERLTSTLFKLLTALLFLPDVFRFIFYNNQDTAVNYQLSQSHSVILLKSVTIFFQINKSVFETSLKHLDFFYVALPHLW